MPGFCSGKQKGNYYVRHSGFRVQGLTCNLDYLQLNSNYPPNKRYNP